MGNGRKGGRFVKSGAAVQHQQRLQQPPTTTNNETYVRGKKLETIVYLLLIRIVINFRQILHVTLY